MYKLGSYLFFFSFISSVCFQFPDLCSNLSSLLCIFPSDLYSEYHALPHRVINSLKTQIPNLSNHNRERCGGACRVASALLPGDPSPATLSDLSLIDSYLLARYSFSFSYFPSDIIYFIIIFLYFAFQLNYLVLVIIV